MCHVVCELNEYIISSNLISGWSEMGVANLIYSTGQGLTSEAFGWLSG